MVGDGRDGLNDDPDIGGDGASVCGLPPGAGSKVVGTAGASHPAIAATTTSAMTIPTTIRIAV